MNFDKIIKEELISRIRECDSLHNNCDCLLEHSDCDDLIEYIEQLQKENEELKNKINNFNLEINKWLENSKAEMREYGDNHEKYWEMFNQLLRKIKNKLIDISDYVVIDRKREEELLNKEDILSEFEKWLIKILNTASAEEYMLFMSCLNKLEELKGEE